MAIKKEIRLKVHSKFNERCAYCGKPIKYNEMQVDHLFPQCLGHQYRDRYYRGKYNLKGDTVDCFENLMPSCRRCNHYKRSYKLEDFRHLIKTINERVLKNYIAKVALDFGTIKTEEWDGIFYFEKPNK